MDSHRWEEERLKANEGIVPPWHHWGPYVSEREWGTVREDYSRNGDAWHYTTHDSAPSYSYRWGEDGIAGICDRYQVLALTFAFWNGKDPILKERLFGLPPYDGNHGEDVKECYYYVDNTPTHSYMKYLYKYPQSTFPYMDLRKANWARSRWDREFELADMGIFNEGRYFDIEIEIAKEGPEDLVIRLEAHNRGPEKAELHLIPQLTFRRRVFRNPDAVLHSVIRPVEGEYSCLCADDSESSPLGIVDFPYKLGKRYLYGEKGADLLFTNNETNSLRLFGKENESSFVKDGFHRYIVDREEEAINPAKVGSKACLHYGKWEIEAGSSAVLRLRFSDKLPSHSLGSVDEIIAKRKAEADQFYEQLHPKAASDEEKRIQRGALSGMMWNKQIYYFEVSRWLAGDEGAASPLIRSRQEIRNKHWHHLLSARILSMPDKWEYPWFAAWDLAFQSIPLALLDWNFAKEQVWLLLFDQFQHPNGQIPAYEWEFSELNPPVQAWAALKLFELGKKKHQIADRDFLKRCFHKLIINFAWWVNKVDDQGNNVFEGGFLGLDNITVIDRSGAIPGGGKLEQSDGTGWMGFFSLCLMRMALELAVEDPEYESMAVKFFEHFLYIGAALHKAPNRDVQIWNEEEGFFYDVITYPNGTHEQIKVRSLVGIIPLFAVDYITQEELDRFPNFATSFNWFLRYRSEVGNVCVTPIPEEKRWFISLMNRSQLERVLSRVWDPEEFRSPFGLRSLSRVYEKSPYELLGRRIDYEPGESVSSLKGGNSNWRGPIWFPTTYLLIEALKKMDAAFQGALKIPAGVTPLDMARYFAEGLIRLFKRDEGGHRPFYGDSSLHQNDPHFKDLLLFYEHFHPETGRGLGASHQTGWTGLVASLIDEWR